MKFYKLNQGLFFLRVTCSSLFLTHGYGKVLKIFNGDFTFRDPIGIGPFPSLIFTAFAEFIVPIFIIIGWKTRFFCIFPIVTMFVAFVFVHDGDPFSKKEKSLLYLLLFISLIIMGPGKYSIDNKLWLTLNCFIVKKHYICRP